MHQYMYVFFFNDTATTEIYTLSLHDALPIFAVLAGEAEALGEVGAHDVAVEDLDLLAVPAPELPLDDVGYGGLAGPREAGEPQREAAPVPACPVLHYHPPAVCFVSITAKPNGFLQGHKADHLGGRSRSIDEEGLRFDREYHLCLTTWVAPRDQP